MSRADWSANRTVRPAAIEDVDRAVEMFNARSRAFYGVNQSTAAEMRSWWSSPRVDLAGGTRVVLDGAGRMVAWAHVAEPTDPCVQIGVGVIVHPDEQANESMWDGLFRWAVEKARSHVERAPSGARVTATESALDYDEARRGAAERAGFHPVRVQNIMRIDLESEPPAPVWPQGIRVRTADIEADLRGIVAADIEAFRDHWGHVERPFESELEEWQRYVEGEGDRCDPTLWFLAVDGEEIVGYSICRPRVADDETRAYVDGLCVRPAWRKRGIALALLHKTFGEFYRRGKAAVELDMDSENLTGALRLYERAGMRVIRRTLNYELVLRDGEDWVTRELRS